MSPIVSRQPLVLPFLAPAVYNNSPAIRSTWRYFSQPSGIRRGGTDGGLNQVPKARSAGLDEDNRNFLRGLRKRLEEEDLVVEEGSGLWDGDNSQSPQKIPRTIRSDYFTEEEEADAHRKLRTVMSKQANDAAALALLTHRARRLPKYLYAILPDALSAVERNCREIQGEIEMLKYDWKGLRQHRQRMRYLLHGGRNIKNIHSQYYTIMPESATQHFVMCMAYLIHYRRLLRLSGRIMEALATSYAAPHPIEIGKAYHMLLVEKFAPFGDVKEKQDDRMRVEAIAADCMDLLLRIVERRNRWPVIVPQVAIHVLVHKIGVSALPSLYWRLLDAKVIVTPFTSFHFVKRLAQRDPKTGLSRWQDGLAILRTLHYRRYNLKNIQSRHAFYGVLYQAMCANDQKSTEEILTMMSECELKPGVEVYNMLLARASEENNYDALKRYFNGIIEAGHEPTMVTHAINHAFHKRHGNEIERQKVVQTAVLLDPQLSLFLATDILHAAVLKEKPYEEVFRRYRNFFKTRLLETFEIALTRDRHFIPGTGIKDKIAPDHVTLAVMITSYCKFERSIEKIWDLYKLYSKILHDRRPFNRQTHQMLFQAGSYIPHAIMLGLGKRIEGLPYVAAVLEDMLKPKSSIKSDVYSWSIFLNFLTRAGKMKESETLMNVMHERGYQPNTVTYTTLLNGYVRAVQLEQAELVLERMRVAGVDPGVFTFTSLLHGYVKDRKNWQAGDVLKRMLDSSVQPDDVTLQAVSGITDREKFETGLAGEPEDGLEADIVDENSENWFNGSEEPERALGGARICESGDVG